ncbi:amidase protein [Mycoavidus cysteinexigens]|uniref:Amidase protein n=1 Tax=Mycoavidus cysteinexigens TaxID=1553431 RepID=A0A2Z6EU79_9BURK|nr:amidase [Mycoavidus cysteinexigens]BBE08962.1 amidase protein [Mycoavidus cysteinexigens]GLR01193.1 amidase [Mycoavidus cysteinexigens]
MKTVRGMALALQNQQITSVRLIEEALARIDAHRRAGGCAWISVDAEHALVAAHASDVARAAGYAPSLLAGLPISIKDLFDIAGQVTRAGSRILANAPPATTDALAVARLRAAGAILLGRTNMSEFAYTGLGLNPHYGNPCTPLDPSRVAGGSSSGAAVSVAGEMAIAALGTDTGGSIRVPAAFCGLTGFKPTAKRVPLTGAIPLSASLDSAGPLAPSVDCCAILDAVLVGQSPSSIETSAANIKGLRLYVTHDYVGAELDRTVHSAFEAALEALSRAGAHIVHFSFPELFELNSINQQGGLVAAEAWTWHRSLIQRAGANYDPHVVANLRKGATLTAADYLDILAGHKRLQAYARQRLYDADAWLMPTAAITPPPLAPLIRDDALFVSTNKLALRNARITNILNGCALTLPCQLPGELPVGLSICGFAYSDARIIRIARAIEAVLATRQHSTHLSTH